MATSAERIAEHAPNYLDHIVFKKRNPIILRSLCLLFAIVIYGCMSIEAWTWTYNDENDGKQKTKRCLYGEDSGGVCTFGIFVSFVALLAAILFLGGEFVIDKASFVNYRRQYYFFELVLSGLWTFLFFVCFCVLESQWNSEGPEISEIERAGAASCVRAAIWFSFFSIPVWGASTYMTLQRYRIMKGEIEYTEAVAGRRLSAYPPPSTSVTGTTGSQSTTVTF